MKLFSLKTFAVQLAFRKQTVITFLTSFIFKLTIAGEDMASPALNNSKLILKQREPTSDLITTGHLKLYRKRNNGKLHT